MSQAEVVDIKALARRKDQRLRATQTIERAKGKGHDMAYITALPLWLTRELQGEGYKVYRGHNQSLVTWEMKK